MAELLRNQQATRAYIDAIRDPKDRLLTEAAVSKATGIWMADDEQRARLVSEPIDLLAYAKAAHAFLRNHQVIEGILSGQYTSLDDLSKIF
jgi:hypothetical protein